MKNKWVWIWTGYLLLNVIEFAVLEYMGWDVLTLSRYVWNLSQDFPLFIYLCGLLTGGLAVHFWWHWNPPGSKSEG